MSESPSNVIGPDLRTALIAMVRKRVPESEVEDIVQSTLADAIESPHAPEDSESLRRWIFGVAKNKVVDYHRRAGRETFEVPEVAGKAAPHVEADLLRWAEKHLPPGEENKTTLDWMLREGEGEKLEWIAETDKVPAPRVRQRVSRLRRHLKTHWQKEVALLAALGVLVTIVALVLREKEPEPIAKEDLPRAAELRKVGIEKCLAAEWKACVDKLDAARELDPAGDTRPEVRLARENAKKALSLPPAPSPTSTPTSTTDDNVAPPPSPTSSASPPPWTDSTGPRGKEPAPTKTVAPVPTPAPPSSAPMPKSKPTSKMDSWFDSDFGSSGTPAPAPAEKTTFDAKDVPMKKTGVDGAGGSGSKGSGPVMQKKMK
ncbi:MAG: sigma-70 family RNA polymerase sigma factor [Labilithrix sp.]|nr:sigma-70 family RNA polymerase sigma factor [Labilithrix sp.]